MILMRIPHAACVSTLESRPIGRRDAYDRVIRVILERYFDRDSNLFSHDQANFRVPRFLLNDVVRYWRTIAVDFAKQTT